MKTILNAVKPRLHFKMPDIKDVSAFAVHVYEIYYDLEDTHALIQLSYSLLSLSNTPE